MSSLLNPLHPGTLFLQKRLGTQFVVTTQITMPPTSTVTLQISPPSGYIWVATISTLGTPRDAATNNPVISPNFYTYARHSMLRGQYTAQALESLFRFPWPSELDLRVNDPFVGTIVNNTALTIVFDMTLAIMEIMEDKYSLYTRLWEGLYNLELLLGGLQGVDVENLVSLLKTIKPVVPVPVPEPKREVVTSPTMSEDLGKPIKRIEIP